jgi:hypothetical protein
MLLDPKKKERERERESILRMFETIIPRNINRKINENGIQKSRFYHELYKPYTTP